MKRKKQDSLTTFSPLPDSLVKWGRCTLLHQKIPYRHEDGTIKLKCEQCEKEAKCQTD